MKDRYDNQNVVISIPASGTIELIYKYQIHAHPDKAGYGYKNTQYYTFRKSGGIMEKLYTLDNVVTIDPYNTSELETYDIDVESKQRILKYINERIDSYKFENKDTKYKFYILNYNSDLNHKPRKPGQNNHCYISIDEIKSGKEFVDTIKFSSDKNSNIEKYDYKPSLWTFSANPKYWKVDCFLNSDKVNNEIYYSINKNHRNLFKIGDKGIIRVGKDNRNKTELKGKQKLCSGVYAIVEVVSNPEFRKDPSDEFYMNPNGINKDKWKVKIKVIKNLINSPIIFNENNKAELNEDRYLVNGFQSATMPLVESVFYKIIDLAYDDKNLIHDKDIDLIDFDKLANDNNGIRILNKIYQNADIKKKEKFVKVIERGKIASEIKKYVGYKCQVCEALGKNPYGFKKKNGDYYVETHHIIPVTDTEKSKLSVENLICVCPNHHRQIHYGNVGIISDNNKYIEYKIDEDIIKIKKIDLDNI